MDNFSSRLSGTASLLDEVDKKLMVELRDGRIFIGYLRSVDQFANLVLHQTVERVYVGKKYGEEHLGLFIIRGDNVTLLGEVDCNKEKETPCEKVPFQEVLAAQMAAQEEKKEKERAISKALKERGVTYHLDPTHEDF